MKKLFAALLFLITLNAYSQNTTTLPGGTSPSTPTIRTLGTDSLHKTYFTFPGIGVNEFYSATEQNLRFALLSNISAYKPKNDTVNAQGYARNWQLTNLLAGKLGLHATADNSYKLNNETFNFSSKANGDILQYNSGSFTWSNVQPDFYTKSVSDVRFAPIVTYGSGTIYKGNGTTTPVASNITDNGTSVEIGVNTLLDGVPSGANAADPLLVWNINGVGAAGGIYQIPSATYLKPSDSTKYTTANKYNYGSTTQYNKTFVAPIADYYIANGQVGTASTPTGTNVVFGTNTYSNVFAWEGSNGNVAMISAGNLQTNRRFFLPDYDGKTFGLLDAGQTYTSAKMSPNVIFQTPTGTPGRDSLMVKIGSTGKDGAIAANSYATSTSLLATQSQISQNVFHLTWPSLFDAFGDSITGASPAYWNYFATYTHSTGTSRAVSGTGVKEMDYNYNANKAATQNTIASTVLIGINDLRNSVSASKQAAIKEGINYVMASQPLDTLLSVSDAKVTKTGSWSTIVFSGTVANKTQQYSLCGGCTLLKTSTAGNTLTFQWYRSNLTIFTYGADVSHNFGSFSVTVDGVLVLPSWSANGKGVDWSFAGTYDFRQPAAVHIGNLGYGGHTIVITALENKEIDFDAFGGSLTSYAPVLVGNVLKLNPAGYAISPANANNAQVDSLNANIDSLGNFWQKRGYPIAIAQSGQFFDANTAYAGTDGLHFNSIGQQEVGNAYINKVFGTTYGTTNKITSTGGSAPVIDISASYVGQGSITTLGTVGTGTWQSTLISPTYGGTGVNNGSSTITVAGNLTHAGAFSTIIRSSAATDVTLPTSGTLYGTAAGGITSAQLATSLTDETGSGGGFARATNPTFAGINNTGSYTQTGTSANAFTGKVGINGTASGQFQTVTTDDTNYNMVSSWDARHSVFGGSGGGGAAVGISFGSTTGSGYITSLQPGVAFKRLSFDALDYQFYTNGTTSVLNLSNAGVLTLPATPATSAGTYKLLSYNTSGGAFEVTTALPSGTTATTGSPLAGGTTIATQAYVDAAVSAGSGFSFRGSGQTTLVSGTKAISVTGVTTSSQVFVNSISQGGTVSTTFEYAAVPTAGTITITALTTGNVVNALDTSTLSYFVIN